MIKVVKILIPVIGIIIAVVVYMLSYSVKDDLASFEKEIKDYAVGTNTVEKSDDFHALKKESLEKNVIFYFQSDKNNMQGIATFQRGINKKYRLLRLEVNSKNELINIAKLKEGKAVYYGESSTIEKIIIKVGDSETTIEVDNLNYFLKTDKQCSEDLQGITLYDSAGNSIQSVVDYISPEKPIALAKNERFILYLLEIIGGAVIIVELFMAVRFRKGRKKKVKKKKKKK